MRNKQSIGQSNFIESACDVEIRNLQVTDFAEGSPFAGKGYEPDEFTAYVTFDMAHTLPGVWLGPVSSGDFLGLLGDTLLASHTRLRRKPFNYRHQMKAYAEPKDKAGKRDRIIGSIVDTAMDPKPMSGYWSPSNLNGAETCIHCCAVVWKLADGVDEILGNHLASREKQGVSIELSTGMDNLTVYRPSTNEMFPYLDLPEAWMPALKAVPGRKRPRVGKLDGEQLLVIYGGGGQRINFRGTAMTPDPAERFAGTTNYAAEITSVNAEADEVMSVNAEAVPQLLCGERMFFASTGRYGRVASVITEGDAGPHRATRANPVLKVALDLAGIAWVPMKKAAGKFL